MSTARLAVIHYPLVTDGVWSSTGTDITKAYDIDVSLSLGDMNDTFSFKIPETSDLYADYFNAQDNINIHLLLNGESVASSNMLINGVVKSIEGEFTERGKFLRINGVSFGEIMTNGLVFRDSNNVNVMEHLEACLTSIQLRSPNYTVTWDATNPTTKYDTSAFPKLVGGGKVSEFDKSMNRLLEKYLTDEYTGDGRYYWYVTTEKKLKIGKHLDNPVGTLTEGSSYLNAKISVDNSKIYNFIVVKCGYDPNNRSITTNFDDAVSRAKNGFKYYMLVDTKIAGNLLENERKNSPSYWTTTSQFPNAYPYTCAWKLNGSTVTASSDADFVSKFRDQAKLEGQDKGRTFATLHNTGLIKASINMRPNRSYTVGNVIQLTAPSYGLLNKSLRITDIQYSDINTVLTCDEVLLS